MIAIVDVHYFADGAARAACVVAAQWTDATPCEERTIVRAVTEPYVPGSLWLREMPPLVDVLAAVASAIDVIVVDAYVTLEGGRPGLGARLHEATGKAVVGIAKTPFRGAPSEPVLCGGSARPLFVTAIGVEAAAEHVRTMHGAHRIPTLVRRADALARGAT